MTIQDVGSIGELVAAIATLATLIYLAIQIRQNTRTVRAASINSNADTSTALALALGQSPELTKLYFDGLAGTSNFDDVQQRQFEMLLGVYLRQVQQVFFLEREGVAGGELVDEYRNHLAFIVSQPGFRTYWKTWHRTAGQWFREIVDTALAEAGRDDAAQHLSGPPLSSDTDVP